MGRASFVDLRNRELAQGCLAAMRLAGHQARLRAADDDELRIAAVLLARSLDQALQVIGAAVLRADAVRQLETAGQAIGAEMRRRALP